MAADRIAAWLATHRAGPSLVRAELSSELDLLAYQCVLDRRAGRQPSSAAIQGYMEALANNIPLRRALDEAARALSAAGVSAIVYKGQDYLERIYGELGARPMADVDLLVLESELGRAERALLDAGWKADRDCKLIHERKFCKNSIAIDLHHALLQPARMRIDCEQLFARAESCSYASGLLVLERTDAFLVHCINQTVKGYQLPPSSYLELEALLAGADPTVAIERARAWNAKSALYCSLRALGTLGHRGALALAECVGLSARRKRMLDGVVVAFARRSILREPSRRTTMLALKTMLIDAPSQAIRFVPEWMLWQLPWKQARPLACDPLPGDGDARRDPSRRRSEAALN